MDCEKLVENCGNMKFFYCSTLKSFLAYIGENLQHESTCGTATHRNASHQMWTSLK